MQLIYEKSVQGRRAITLDPLDVPDASLPRELCREKSAELPEVAEIDVIRHFTNLSRRNFGVDSHFYPLGSCTMKYNPKIAEAVAALPGFGQLHPHLSSSEAYWPLCQGAFELLYETEKWLAEIAGMKQTCLQPIAGAHGELAGTLLIAAYHRDRGQRPQRHDHHPRFRARHQSRQRGDGGLQSGGSAVGRRRHDASGQR